MSEQPPQEPSVRATSWTSVGLAAVVGAGAGWGLFAALETFGVALPQLPLAATGTIVIVAAVIGRQAYVTHRTIHRRGKLIPARTAVALLALGKTVLLSGAALAGAYAAIAAHALPRIDAAFPRERAVSAVFAVVASAGLAITGYLLERACQIPNPPPDDQSATPGEDPGEAESQR